MYTAGPKGPNTDLISILEPLFTQYNVTAYIHGHEHILAHITNKGINHIITGRASDKMDPAATSAAVAKATLNWVGADKLEGGYTLFQATTESGGTVSNIKMTFYDAAMNKIYCSTLSSTRVLATAATSSPSSSPSVIPSFRPSTPSASPTSRPSRPTSAPSTISPTLPFNSGSSCPVLTSDPKTLSFIIFGDWGTASSSQKKCANTVSL